MTWLIKMIKNSHENKTKQKISPKEMKISRSERYPCKWKKSNFMGYLTSFMDLTTDFFENCWKTQYCRE